MGRPRRRECASNCWIAGEIGCGRRCWTRRRASRCRAASTSARPKASPTSRTAITSRSTRTWTHGSHRESQGEDLNVVNLLLSQWGSLFTNTEEFTGQPSIVRAHNNIVYATQENRQHFLGHLTLLGLKREVAPWCSDGPSEAE